MPKLKVMSVVGTRPEIIRLSRVFSQLDEHCEHTLVHTGQNYDFELNQIFFNELELKAPDFYLNAAGESAADTIGSVISKVDKILSEIKPQAFLILGDTNSCLSAISAKRQKVPIFHMEAGNRCFDQRRLLADARPWHRACADRRGMGPRQGRPRRCVGRDTGQGIARPSRSPTVRS